MSKPLKARNFLGYSLSRSLCPRPGNQGHCHMTSYHHSTNLRTSSIGVHPFVSQAPDNSYQKEFKAARKERSKRKRHESGPHEEGAIWGGPDGNWELNCGLEIHAQLNSQRKLFSEANTSLNDEPNTHVALFDAALPGTQPRFQPAVLLPALRAAVALNCRVQHEARFDRKHYFYWDQPSGYQITQFYHPLAKDGYIKLLPSDLQLDASGEPLTIGIKQIQLEQDTAKTIHSPVQPTADITTGSPMPNSVHLIDLNRVSHPLIEIITHPELPTPQHAAAAFGKIQHILKITSAAIIGMEWGGIRCDVNVSVRLKGSSELGQRTEIKNLASLKNVADAVEMEAREQVSTLLAGGKVNGETRGWDADKRRTFRLRGKEGEIDYRYMPDPDISPLFIPESLVSKIKATLPLLPDQLLEKLKAGPYNLTVKDAKTLMTFDNGNRINYYFKVVSNVKSAVGKADIGKVVGNWVIHELEGQLASAGLEWAQNPVDEGKLSDIIVNLMRGNISGLSAKKILQVLLTFDSREVPALISDLQLAIIPLSSSEKVCIVEEVVNSLPAAKILSQYWELYKKAKEAEVKGKQQDVERLEKKMGSLRGWFVGQVVRSEKVLGRLDAADIGGIIEDVLKARYGERRD